MAASSASLHPRQSSASACVAEAGAGWPRWWSPLVSCSWRSSASSSSSSPSPSASSWSPSPCRSSRTAPHSSRPRTRDETNWNLVYKNLPFTKKKYSFVPKKYLFDLCLEELLCAARGVQPGDVLAGPGAGARAALGGAVRPVAPLPTLEQSLTQHPVELEAKLCFEVLQS